MTYRRSMPNTFHRMGGSYNHYFDPNHFLGQDAFSDIWDSRNNTEPMTIREDLHIDINLPGFSESEIEVLPYRNRIRVKASMTEGQEKEIQDEYLAKELHMESYNETFTIPKNIDIKKMYKAYDGKTLKISIPYLLK